MIVSTEVYQVTHVKCDNILLVCSYLVTYTTLSYAEC